MKRLLRARNPEQKVHANHNLTDPFSNTTNTQWSLAYTYDANSNLLTKTDSRNATAGQAPVTATFTYDALNRNTFVSYSIYQNGTASVERHYDTAPLGKGKFGWVAKYNTESDGTLTYNYDFINSYDAVGRPTSKTQKILYYQGGWATKDFTTSVTYDLASNVLSQTYPSGRIVNYAYDAAGRTTDFTGNLGGTQRNYATAMQYTAAGLMAKETFGTTTALYHRMNYNVRQQMFGVRVGTYSGTQYDDDPLQAYYNQGSSWDRGMLISHYGSTGATSDFSSWGTSGTNNNGNVLRGHHFIPGGIYVSDYEYDGLNRLKKDTGYGNANYVQAFDYDQWGNRKINQAGTTTSPDINKKDFTVDTATNRLGVPSGQSGAMNYDDVGNLILDTYTSALTAGMQYDADNKMTSAANGGQQYRYNADGKRVKRIITGTGGGTYWMVYGIGGELVAEYNATSSIPAVTSPSKEYGYRGGQMLIVAESSTVVKWLVQDHLGSTRMEIGVGGAIGDVIRHDYLPFGEELAGSMRGGNGYGGATNTKQRFTGYERDTETGLDYAQARYMSSVQGRFTSVDPDGIGAAISEPQSWNGYSYVGNRPTTLTDPSGLRWYQHTRKNGKIDIQWFDSDPGKGWTEVVFNGNETQYYESRGSIYAISRNDRNAYNLTAEVMREARALRLEQAHELNEQRTNRVIRDFIVYSAVGAVAVVVAAPVTIAETIKVVALTVAADRLDDRTGGLYSAATVVVGAAAPKLLARFNSVESLIEQAGSLQPLKNKAKLGSVQGDADDIFNGLARQYGAKIQMGKNGFSYFESGGTRVGMHNSTKQGGLPTLDININGSVTKIRVTP